jgi:hypothetical protein
VLIERGRAIVEGEPRKSSDRQHSEEARARRIAAAEATGVDPTIVKR